MALLLRLGFVFVGFPVLESRWHLREDGDGYGDIARTIREGRYDDIVRGPVYPWFVAAAGSPTVVKVLQALLDAATCALIFLLAGVFLRLRHTDGGPASPLAPRPALLASVLWSIYPFAIWRVAFINKEILLTFLLVSYLGVQLLAWRDGRLAPWIAAGLLLGLVNLCKPTFLLWPLVLVLLGIRCGRQWWRGWAVLCGALLVMVLPWTYRNYRVTGGEFLPVATERGGVTTFIGNYQPTLGLWEGPGKVRWMAAVEDIQRQHAGASAVELDREYYRAAWREVVGNPAKAAELFGRKCVRFWLFSAARREQVASVLIQAIYLALAVLGLWRARPWRREVVLLVALIGYVMLLHAASYADMRFSLPVMSLVCALAGGLWFQGSGFRPSRSGPVSPKTDT